MHNGKQGAMQGTQFADQITIKKKNWVPPRSEHRVQVAHSLSITWHVQYQL
jgi:hypothetical protein